MKPKLLIDAFFKLLALTLFIVSVPLVISVGVSTWNSMFGNGVDETDLLILAVGALFALLVYFAWTVFRDKETSDA
jgi:hypothetical protein